jgi:hypothetical protein
MNENFWAISARVRDTNELQFLTIQSNQMWTTNPTKATTTTDKETILSAYGIVLDLLAKGQFKSIIKETVKPVILTVSLKESDILETELIHIRQKIALSKLSSDQIRDLELESIAVLHKLENDIEPKGLHEIFAEKIKC